MILSFSNIIPYVINQLTWISESNPRAQITLDDFFILNDYNINEFPLSDSRNRCFSIVNLSDNRNYFLKQPKNFLSESIKSVVKESIVYDTIWNSDSLKSFTKNISRMYDYNSNDIIIISSFLKDSIEFRKKIENISVIEVNSLISIAEKIGKTLKEFHQVFKRNNNFQLFDIHSPFFRESPPLPLLSIDFSIIEHQKRFNGDLSNFIEAIMQESTWKALVKDSISHWKNPKYQTFVHGDFSIANVLVSNTKLFFIDWELSSVGNYLFDIATFRYSLIRFELQTKNTVLVLSNYDDIFRSLLEGYGKQLSKNDTKIINTFIALHLLDYFIRQNLQGTTDETAKLLSTKIRNLINHYLGKGNDVEKTPIKIPVQIDKFEQIEV